MKRTPLHDLVCTLNLPQHLEESTMYAVVGNSDAVEGRGADVILGYHATQGAAIQAARGAGPSGGNAKVEPVEVLLFHRPGEAPSFMVPARALIDLRPRASLAEQALAKLTPEERRALGF